MPRFHVRDTFALPDRNLFVLAGSILEGVIRVGMFVNIPFNPALAMTARIHSIEFARRRGGSEDVCLCVESPPDELDLWQALDIGDETIEVTTEGSD